MMVRAEGRRAQRKRRARLRRRRLGLLVLFAAIAVAIGLNVSSGPGRHLPVKPNGSRASGGLAAAATPAAVEAGLLPWQLAAPLSREVVLPQHSSDNLLVVGGLTANGSSVGGIYSLNTQTGKLSFRGSLPRPTHDAAAATLSNGALVIGGGTATPVATTQRIQPDGNTGVAASLPKARADATAVTIGKTVYLVGGYNGPAMDSEVLATRTGGSYRGVAALAVPVRYPAVAALDGRIYVFGGATRAGHPVATVQLIDLRTHASAVIGHLPIPLAGAAAALLGKTIYIAGGTTGAGLGQPTDAVFAFDPAHASLLRAGSLQVAVANAGAAVIGDRLWIIGGETAGERPSTDVQVLTPNRGFGIAGHAGAGSPFYGDRLLIADRGNNRLLVLNDTDKIIWSYPSRTKPAPPGGFYFPDDAFFIRRGKAIISNQEDNDTIVEIAYPSGRILFQYGHPRKPGPQPGYLNSPDDTYLLPNGDITVADASNCRVLILDPATKHVVHQIGTSGRCLHRPPTELGSPNGDTPLSDGNLLISEVNGSWIDEYTLRGRLIWNTKLAIGYPSDPQQLRPDRYLIANYETPGAIIEFNRSGQITYRYQPASGTGMLNHPSLVELLPTGAFMVNDDYNDRMAAIDPITHALVWQYGITGRAGTAPGRLNTPDGFDVITAGDKTPTHAATG